MNPPPISSERSSSTTEEEEVLDSVSQVHPLQVVIPLLHQPGQRGHTPLEVFLRIVQFVDTIDLASMSLTSHTNHRALAQTLQERKLDAARKGAQAGAAVAGDAQAADTAADSDTSMSNDASLSNDNDDDQEQGVVIVQPPSSYLPGGWIVFWKRGPMAPTEERLDILSLAKPNGKGGRKAWRAEDKEKEASQRDRELGSSGGGSRGLAYGASSQKDVALIAQQQARINTQNFEAKILQTDMLLKSKNSQVESKMKMAAMYEKFGDIEKAKAQLECVDALMKEIQFHEVELYNLKNSGPTEPVEVEEYLKMGRKAMNIEPAKKKQKPASSSSSSGDWMLVDVDGEDM